jgi:elongation factor Ts
MSATISSPLRRMGSTVTAQMVKDLRERSGAPMMDCKKALADPEVEGSIDKAMDWLRAKGMAKARSNANRPASEGLIALVLRDNIATLVEVNSETDFVARNTDFQSLVQRVALTANQSFAAGAVSVEALLEAPAIGGTRILREFLTDAVTKIRENIVSDEIHHDQLPSSPSSCYRYV